LGNESDSEEEEEEEQQPEVTEPVAKDDPFKCNDWSFYPSHEISQGGC
jgi:hypothetical protein